MTTVVDQRDLTVVMDHVYAAPGRELYLRFAGSLARRAFNVRQTEPPESGGADAFRGGLRAEREIVLDRTKRQIGKWMFSVGIVMTIITLAAMIMGEERVWVLEWLITIEVIVGGLGLMFIKNPPDRRRTVLDLTFSGGTDGVRVIAREGVGRVEDGQIFEWSDEPELAVTAAEIEAMGSEGAEQ